MRHPRCFLRLGSREARYDEYHLAYLEVLGSLRDFLVWDEEVRRFDEPDLPAFNPNKRRCCCSTALL